MKIGGLMLNGIKNKKDLFALSIFIILTFFIYFLITRGTYLYGSTLDWSAQHYLIPEYFRNLFYTTGDLFPDFAPHLGGGQNIYYFSYYGLFNPFILFSYFLPFIKMIDYIQILGVVLPLLSTILFYFYLKRHVSFKIAFVTSFLFLCAGPILFHSHRHWMFMNYFPFFMLALYGIDHFLEKGKMSLLTISCFFIIMTSYYYSIGSFLALFIYGLYRILKEKRGKQMIIKLCIPFLLSILMSAILIFPTFYTLFAGRDKTGKSVEIFSLFLPKRNYRFLLYETYAIGVTGICLISILHLFFTKKRENIFMGILLICISIFPFFNYILNAGLYVNAKTLIPFLPLVLFSFSLFLTDLFSKKISFKEIFILCGIVLLFTNSKVVYLDIGVTLLLFLFYYKTKRENIFLFFLCIFLFGVCIKTNLGDKLELKNTIEGNDYHNMEEIISYITQKEQNIYRINNAILPGITMNKIQNRYHYTSTLYSSTFNKTYNDFFFEKINNLIPYRNKSMTPASLHPLFQILFGEKYLLTKGNQVVDGKKIYEKGDIKVYEKAHVLPIGYATSHFIKESFFEKWQYPNTIFPLLGSVLQEDGEESFLLEKENLIYEMDKQQNVKLEKTKDGYKVLAKKGGILKLKLDKKYQDRLVFIRFKNRYNPKCGLEELAITINGKKNKLSCATWKYHNQNFVFDYVLEKPQELKITFAQGFYALSDFEIYSLSYEKLYEIVKEVDPFIFDKKATYGDDMVGDIHVKKDGYFIASIPYDKGFKASVDGKEVNVLKMNNAFIGFEIKKGDHQIQIVYEAPYKKESLWMSGIGFFLLGIMLWYEKRDFRWKK